ncbi:MAG: hypothetical protein LBK74_05150 [Treponema sp.]|jgi:hypothetical protein|nr:hypothetical protein [Treponema sp.]
MILGAGTPSRQGRFFLFILASLCWGCSPKLTAVPPAAPPLSRDILGYGVVTASYIRVLDEPNAGGVALGYVREKTILQVLERRLIKEGDAFVCWVLIDGSYQGWLPESAIVIYDNEGRAETAAGR